MGTTHGVLGVAELVVLKPAFSYLLRQRAVASVIDEATAPELAGTTPSRPVGTGPMRSEGPE